MAFWSADERGSKVSKVKGQLTELRSQFDDQVSHAHGQKAILKESNSTCNQQNTEDRKLQAVVSEPTEWLLEERSRIVPEKLKTVVMTHADKQS